MVRLPGRRTVVSIAAALSVLCNTVVKCQTLRPAPAATAVTPNIDASGLLPMIIVHDRSKGTEALRSLADIVRTKAQLSQGEVEDLLAQLQAANRLVRDDASFAVRYLRLYSIDPEIVSKAEGKNALGALIATSLDQRRTNEILAQVTDKEQREAMTNEVQEIRRRVTEALGKRTFVAVYADGTIREALNGTGDKDAVGTGSVGLAATFVSGWRFSASVAVAASIDSVKSAFGGVVLVPGAGRGRLGNVLIDVRTPNFLKNRPALGAYGYIGASNSQWRVDTGATTFNDVAAVAGLGAGLYLDVLQERLLNTTDLGISARIGWAGRYVQGNVGSNDAERTVALNGNPKSSFNGPELGLELQIGGVMAGVHYYHLGKGDGAQVPSLTGGQWVIGLGVAASVVSGPVSGP